MFHRTQKSNRAKVYSYSKLQSANRQETEILKIHHVANYPFRPKVENVIKKQI